MLAHNLGCTAEYPDFFYVRYPVAGNQKWQPAIAGWISANQ